jgi:hypothetical protein
MSVECVTRLEKTGLFRGAELSVSEPESLSNAASIALIFRPGVRIPSSLSGDALRVTRGVEAEDIVQKDLYNSIELCNGTHDQYDFLLTEEVERQ